jgi:hypothetical protein
MHCWPKSALDSGWIVDVSAASLQNAQGEMRFCAKRNSQK